ncbi:MAG: DUF4912 domain-containing protein [Candidatus Omnitrophota bacterium]
MAIRKKKITEKIKKLISKVRKKKPLMLIDNPVPEKVAQPYVRPFLAGVMKEPSGQREKELPEGYGDTKIILLVRDPWWLYAYWEITEEKKNGIKHKIGLPWGEIKKYLRVYDVTNINFNGTNAHSFFDIEINDFANNWYIDVGKPDHAWIVDLNAKDEHGKFYLIARSNCVMTPRDTMSWMTDEEWMIDEDEFRRMYALGSGLRGTSPAGIKKLRKMQMQFGSGYLMSPVKKPGHKPSPR